MDKIEDVSKLDTVEAAGLPGASCCAEVTVEDVVGLLGALSAEERLLFERFLDKLMEQREDT